MVFDFDSQSNGDGEWGRWGDGDPPLTPPRRGIWGDGEMEGWGDGEVEKDLVMALRWNIFFFHPVQGLASAMHQQTGVCPYSLLAIPYSLSRSN
ncbi:MAG: hypothetical protein F6K35_43090 [Okeania sp. SIO2H7]|nr:hypothetical protein [Okeania sp. SIO2H7]